MFLVSRTKVTQAGDTIVEVLLCIAIVGAVIMGAYSLASNSLQEGISSSQHTQAIKAAESQVELLKYRQKSSLTATDWDQFTGANLHFCIKSGATPSDTANWKPFKNLGSPTDLRTGATRYNAECAQDNNRYFIDITTPAAASASPTFLVTIRWTPPGNGPLSQTQLYYRF